MIVTVSTASVSHSTNPIAAALTAGFRSASFKAADRMQSATSGAAPLDVDRLYPNLSTADAPVSLKVVRHGIALVRRAFAAAR